MIVRAADFYGPGATLSMIHSTVVERLHAKKGPQWIGDPKRIHTFTYTPDAGRAVAVLGNTPTAFNQTWHALTSKKRITGEELVKLACTFTDRPYSIQALPKLGVRVLGLFVPVVKEIVEMMYQFETDYVFDSTKFESAFTQQATSYEIGIKETLLHQ
jgi:nucleoside-diphosphate-sugar epimerase